VRVAPGFGYELYKGAVGAVLTTLDAQIGFAYFTSSTSLDLRSFGPLGNRLLVNTVSDSNDFGQPWLGLRAAIYPWPHWRFTLSALVQGFGASGGLDFHLLRDRPRVPVEPCRSQANPPAMESVTLPCDKTARQPYGADIGVPAGRICNPLVRPDERSS
jgi:hypothetical protein